MKKILSLLPQNYMKHMVDLDLYSVDEIRLRVGQPLVLRNDCKEHRIWPAASADDLEQVLMNACRHSVYAYNETLKHGYVTVEGGHRVGVCGFGVMRGGDVQTIQSVSSLDIRIARQIHGCANKLLPHITGSTLLLGPPGSGKTTLLRDLIRQLSDVRGQRISLVDERAEISAGVFGIPQLQIGQRTDVLINIPKASAAIMMLRTMNPQWIAMDEITAVEDVAAMDQIVYCGVHILATAHGCGLSDLEGRPLYRDMMQRKIFDTVVLLSSDKSYEIKEC